MYVYIIYWLCAVDWKKYVQVQRALRKSVREAREEPEADDADDETQPKKKKPKAKAKTKASSKRKAEKAAVPLQNERQADEVLSEAVELEEEEDREKNELREEAFEVEKKKTKKKGAKNKGVKNEIVEATQGVKRRLDFNDCDGPDEDDIDAGDGAEEKHDEAAQVGLGACAG